LAIHFPKRAISSQVFAKYLAQPAIHEFFKGREVQVESRRRMLGAR
jgi:hypothetical protein